MDSLTAFGLFAVTAMLVSYVRAGGEEFVVLLSDTDTYGAMMVSQKIIRAVKETPLGDEARKVNLTVSLGIVSYPEAGISEASALLDAADHAMYQSKGKGRNKTTVYNGAPAEEEEQKLIVGDENGLYANLKGRLRNISLRNEESILESLMPLVREVDKREGYARGHIDKILNEIEILAMNLSMSENEVLQVKRAALLCNLGLLSVPAEVLMKTEPLNEDEVRLIREYPVRSAEMIRPVSFLAPLAKDIVYHHERYDGRGYPQGLKGEAIPLGARMIHAVETFEALIVPRPYRSQAYSKNKAFEIIERESGRQFDPLIVERFLKVSA